MKTNISIIGGIIMGLALNGAMGAAKNDAEPVSIREEMLEGEQAVILENAYYKAILLPHRAIEARRAGANCTWRKPWRMQL